MANSRLQEDGIKLDRHHTYLWCSPTRRAFLSGRYVTHMTGTQAPQCSNFLPLQFTILSEKLKAADYQACVASPHPQLRSEPIWSPRFRVVVRLLFAAR